MPPLRICAGPAGIAGARAMTQAMAVESLEGVPMSSLVEQVLPFRTTKYIEDFCEKMLGEGVAAPADLLRVSKEALMIKLQTHAAFNFIEMADAISLYTAIGRPGGESASNDAPTRSRSSRRCGRSRSNDRNGGCRKRAVSNGGHRGMRNNTGPHRGGGKGNSRPARKNSNNERVPKIKPDLWAAIELNDDANVQELLASGSDPEEKFEGWTPLMKASEGGGLEIMRMLLEKKVDIEASNRKGRTALSFAACPSHNGNVPRETPVAALRLLLENGADSKHKDERGKTAKDYASNEKREEALAVFAQMGL